MVVVVKFVGAPLDIPAATANSHAVQRSYVDAIGTRVTTLEGKTGGLTPVAFVSANGASTYTASANQVVVVNANAYAASITLPAGPTAGMTVVVKKTDSSTNPVTVAGSGGALIDGDASAVLQNQGTAAEFVWDSASSTTQWRVSSTAITVASTVQPAPSYNGTSAFPVAAAGLVGSEVYDSSTGVFFECVTWAGVPYWVPRPGTLVAQARQSTVQGDGSATMASGIFYPITWTACTAPWGGWSSALTGSPPTASKFIPPFPGYYTCNGGFSWSAGGSGYRQLGWGKNALALAAIVRLYLAGVTSVGHSMGARSFVLSFGGTASADYLTLQARHDVASAFLQSDVSTGYEPSLTVVYTGVSGNP